jgi:hypothetical protein
VLLIGILRGRIRPLAAPLLLGCRRVPALAVTALFSWHPIIDDISSWNAMGYALTAGILAMAAYFLAWRATAWGIGLAAVCVFCSLATYQLMVPLPVCMAVMVFVHLGVVEERWEWRRTFAVAAGIGLAFAIYLVYVVVLSPMIFGRFEGASLSSPADLVANFSALVSQTINLYLNLFYTPLSYYGGVLFGLGHWYYLPAAIVASGAAVLLIGILRGRIRPLAAPLLLGCWIGLPFLAIAPLWFIPMYTDWRISFVPLLAQVMVLGSIMATLVSLERRSPEEADAAAGLGQAPRVLGYVALVTLVVCIGLLAPVTHADSRMRIADYRHDVALVESIRTFRRSLGEGAEAHRVAYVEGERSTLALTGQERAMMKANYLVNTYSTFSYGKLWAHAMFRWYGLSSITSDELEEIALPDSPALVEGRITRFTDLPWVEHYPEQRLSVVVGSPQWFTWTLAP